MGLATNIILLMLCISFFFYLDGVQSTFTALACSLGYGRLSSPIQSQCANYKLAITIPVIGLSYTTDLYGAVMWLFGATTIGAVMIAFFFPNPYALFAPLGIFLLGVFTFPVGIFAEASGFPPEAGMLVGVFYSVAYLFAIIGFLRGGMTP